MNDVVSVRGKDDSDVQALMCLLEEAKVLEKLGLVEWDPKGKFYVRKKPHKKIMEVLKEHYENKGFFKTQRKLVKELGKKKG